MTETGRVPAADDRLKKPESDDAWLLLGQEISTLFDGAPVDEEDLFAGRAAEIRKIIEAVLSRSTHVVLFGEKGVGKTSLANVFWKRFNRTLRSLIIARIQAGPNDTFSSLWGRALEELHAAGASSGKPEYVDFDYDQETWTPSKIRRELQKCAANALPIIVIDEYSELADPDARKLTAHLIKEFYDFSVTTTVILVGVAENISELIEDHQSIDRAIVEIQLGRMSNTELTEIIRSRCARTVMTFTPNAISTINVLSRGLPYFTQTLSRHAALHTIDNRRIEVTENDVDASMGRFIENSQRSFREMYQTAIRSNQSNFFAQSLLACALAKADDDGFFTANDIVEPYSEIMKDRKRIAHFDKHLLRFSSDGGGNILTRRGSARKQQFRFSNPMMQAYVIIHGIRDGLIPDEARAVLLRHD